MVASAYAGSVARVVVVRVRGGVELSLLSSLSELTMIGVPGACPLSGVAACLLCVVVVDAVLLAGGTCCEIGCCSAGAGCGGGGACVLWAACRSASNFCEA